VIAILNFYNARGRGELAYVFILAFRLAFMNAEGTRKRYILLVLNL